MGAAITCCTVAAGMLLLFLLQPVIAMFSRECALSAMDEKRPRAPGACPHSICGHLDFPVAGEQSTSSFLKRMSPQCQTLMQQYRRPDLDTPLGLQLGVKGPCPERRGATSPTNPVVVDAPGMHGFVICTVPKSGCTNLRKLMHAVINGPQKPEDAAKVLGNPHRDDYASLWHFDTVPLPPDIYPSFVVGRNPYIRLLSGFLDKMILNKERVDQTTGKMMNENLGLHEANEWASTLDSFHAFVRTLSKRGTHGVNIHFAEQLKVCGRSASGIEFEYYLRIEEMANWFPCWDQGLGLTSFTSKGWAKFPYGKVYVGSNNENTDPELQGVEKECWWYPPGTEGCEDYFSKTHVARESGDEDGKASDVTAVPWDEELAVSEVRKNDAHDTSAATKWKRFYTQEVGDLVYQLFKKDFVAFGYPKETFSTVQ